ncbi:ABC transporter permease [Mycoplasma sp. Mirounga ES2805-ORL]|uniref:ABC transporter permease n=1 Tax=Mycoplasma sp. Mirounga ES2805-ORL TaxID=754514 RepID=UPI00197C3348|nr:ABC transporter permease [Mycoplasma sp. Mirounga ES2805-ORL]QSF13785.1 ABC transporter permease [Mycoplasma sp. Mirounga ES2805-ORL]
MEIIIIASVTFSLVLALAAISGSIIERSGIINLSIEAFIILGGLNYSIMSHYFRNDSLTHQVWLILISGFIPMLFGLLYAFVTITLKANQTIAGIALNTLALAVTAFAIVSKINPGYETSTQYISMFSELWSFGSHQRDLLKIFNIGVLISLILIPSIVVMLNKTKLGIKIKTCGENPDAASSLGINVVRTRYIAVLISSFLTGIAGAIFFQNDSGLFVGNTYGIGFLAVAMVIFGQWRPTYIILSSLVFGPLYIFSSKILLTPFSTIIPSDLFQMIPYVVTIVILAFTQKNSKAPKYLGIPFVNKGR